MNKTKKLLNFQEVSRRLGYHEKGLRPDTIPEKYKEYFKSLYKYIEEWIEMVKNK